MPELLMPVGARILVRDNPVVLEIEESAKAAGLTLVTYERNRPRPTDGIVIALGDDPEVHVRYKVGDKVFFRQNAGDVLTVEGVNYHMLEWNEVLAIRRPNDGGIENTL